MVHGLFRWDFLRVTHPQLLTRNRQHPMEPTFGPYDVTWKALDALAAEIYNLLKCIR